MKPLVSALALMACVSTANAQDFKWELNINHYTIKGADGYTLTQQMEKRGPKVKKESASRSWAASFFKLVEGTYEPCYMVVKVDILMPRWKDYDRASPADKANWDKFYNFVLHHEMTHVKHYQSQEAFIKAHHCEDNYIREAWQKADALGVILDARDNYIPKELTDISPSIVPVSGPPK